MNKNLLEKFNSLSSFALKSIFNLMDVIDDQSDRSDIRIVLAHILKQNYAWMITHDDYILSDAQSDCFKLLLAKLADGIPVSYIIGVKEFYSRDFVVNSEVLVPRPETELLVDQVLKLAPSGALILDLGCGSGCIGISCKLERSDLHVCASDISHKALILARQNAIRLGASLDFICSNWFSAFDEDNRFDLIVSNPPYISKDDFHLANLTHEPLVALTDFNDGLDYYRVIIQHAINYLKPVGYLILEHGFDQSIAIGGMLSKYKFFDIQTIKDYSGTARITIARVPQ